MGPRQSRPILALVLAAAIAAAAASTPVGHAAAADTPSDAQIISTVCNTIPTKLLRRIQLGARTDRSGQIQILPKEPNYVDGGLPHAGPWDYVQDVPLLMYGPGVKPGVYTRPVTLADVAPTEGSMLKFDGFHAPDGTPLSEGLQPADQRTAPKLLVVLIWDSGGNDVLDRWPHDWPYLKSMAKKGAWFTHATAGASPSNTPVSHATIGTGAFPDKHGFTDEYVEVNDRIQKPNENGPGFLIEPTFADIYDRDMGNKPIVGGIATLSAHIMMMSHGSMWGGGDQDIAVTREQEHGATAGAESVSWDLTGDMAPFYTLPDYSNQVGNLAADARALDRRDGKLDGKWRQNSIAQYGNGFDTPARTPYQTSLIKSVIAREGFGKDETPDLLYLNYKAIDSIGHIWSADGIEMSDTLRIQDENLKILVDYLNQVVGKDQWNMILTADHGTNRDPLVTGAWRIGIDELTADIGNTFDDDHDGIPLIMKVRPTEVWFDMDELKQNGFTLDQVSNYIANLTEAQTIKNNVETPKPGEANTKVFSGAWPTALMSKMPCLPHGQDEP